MKLWEFILDNSKLATGTFLEHLLNQKKEITVVVSPTLKYAEEIVSTLNSNELQVSLVCMDVETSLDLLNFTAELDR